jgi:hypothetical protein
MRTYVFALLAFAMLALAGCPLPNGGGECPDTDFEVCGEDGATYQNPCFAQKAGTSIAYEGACSSQSGNCTDEDGGKDIFVSSTIVSGGDYESDYCLDTLVVVENFCSASGEASSEQIPCPAGYSCSNGACEATPCTDSDGGMVLGTKGTASSGSDSGTDSCEDSSTLIEYICRNGEVESEEVGCPSSKECIDGACTELQCTDTDGGENSNEAGTASKGSLSQSDSCFDSNTVKEYYCEGGDIKSRNIDCARDDVCIQGECVSAPSCIDTDGGKDRYTFGTTSYGGDSEEDACYNEEKVVEYYCEDEEIKSVQLVCGSGYKCDSGVCVELECEAEAQEFDEEGERFELADDGSISENYVRLYAGDAIEVDGDRFLQLDSVSTGEATFRLFEDYDAFRDEDELCEETIEEGGSTSDLCETGQDLDEVFLVSETGDYAEISLDEYYITQYTDSEGFDVVWSGSDCDEEKRAYTKQRSWFYPYLDTDSDGLDLDGEVFIFFGMEAELQDVDVDSGEIEFEIDGDDYTLTNGEDFEYEDNEYDVDLDFNEIGLVRLDLDLK